MLLVGVELAWVDHGWRNWREKHAAFFLLAVQVSRACSLLYLSRYFRQDRLMTLTPLPLTSSCRHLLIYCILCRRLLQIVCRWCAWWQVKFSLLEGRVFLVGHCCRLLTWFGGSNLIQYLLRILLTFKFKGITRVLTEQTCRFFAVSTATMRCIVVERGVRNHLMVMMLSSRLLILMSHGFVMITSKVSLQHCLLNWCLILQYFTSLTSAVLI